MEPMLNRLRGCLYGLAVGDALGAAVEFKGPGTFAPVTGYRGGGPHGLKAGEWTDDTAMAVALADSIASVGWDLDDQASRYLEWYRRGRYSVNGRCFDIGNQTRKALKTFEEFRIARGSDAGEESASGNGSIMRLAPVIVAYAGYYPDRVELLLDRAEDSSVPTHASPICRSACRYLGMLLAAFVHGVPRGEALDASWPMLQRVGPLHAAVQDIAAGSYRGKRPPAIRGGGYVVECLEAALWSFYDAKDFREAALRAVNLGDDADTTGAVCGQLAGARWGEAGIPQEWLERLAGRDTIESTLRRLLETVQRPGASRGVVRQRAVAAPNVPQGARKPPDRSYWIAPGQILGGCYPGSPDAAERDSRLNHLLDLGVRTFLNLTRKGEKHRGQALEPYELPLKALASARSITSNHHQFEVQDLGVPTEAQMEKILSTIDSSLREGALYVHCLGGVGRTGTVAACWLLSQGDATAADVLDRTNKLRAMDRVAGGRPWPESGKQREFVLNWAERLRNRRAHGRVVSQLPSLADDITSEQACFFARLIHDFATAERRRGETPLGDLPEYQRLIEGAYACGFVCRDIDGPAFASRFEELIRRPEELETADLTFVRSIVHTMMRGERHCDAGLELAGGYVHSATRSGALEIIAERLENWPVVMNHLPPDTAGRT